MLYPVLRLLRYYPHTYRADNSAVNGGSHPGSLVGEADSLKAVFRHKIDADEDTGGHFDESGEFEYDAPHTVLLCNLILGLYSRGEFKEAMALLAVAFMMAGMEDSAGMMGAAAAGYTEENGRYYLEQFFDHSGLIETYLLGLELYGEEEDADGEDDSDM